MSDQSELDAGNPDLSNSSNSDSNADDTFPCPSCHSINTVNIKDGLFRCNICRRRYEPKRKITDETTSDVSVKPLGKRIEDLVSSDDDGDNDDGENGDEEQSLSSSNTLPIDGVAAHVDVVAATSNSDDVTWTSLTDPLRLTDGESNFQAAFSSPPDITLPSSPPAPLNSTSSQSEYSLDCHKVMFGELYGHSLAPVTVKGNRMYLSLECVIVRGNIESHEKYTLSVGWYDVEKILIHFSRGPSFIAIETSKKFASVTCKRIGRDVLVPESEDPKKRYILLALKTPFKNDYEIDAERRNLIEALNPWAPCVLLTHVNAELLIKQAKLDVEQTEIYPDRTIKSDIDQCDLALKVLSYDDAIDMILDNGANKSLEAALPRRDSFSIICNKVKFGRLTGKSNTPVEVFGSRMHFNFSCLVKRHQKRSLENLTFSVGISDVNNMFVYVGSNPSFMMIQTTKDFAELACKRIGLNILCPEAADPKRKYIFLTLDKSYSETNNKSKKTEEDFRKQLSSWTRLVFLSSSEAMEKVTSMI